MDKESSQKFMAEQQRATERMFEMQSRSKFGGVPHGMPPTPPFVKLNGNRQKGAENSYKSEVRKSEEKGGIKQSIFGDFSIPFLSDFTKDSDLLLIIGLLLILESEKGDRLLLAALLYIMS